MKSRGFTAQEKSMIDARLIEIESALHVLRSYVFKRKAKPKDLQRIAKITLEVFYLRLCIKEYPDKPAHQ